MFDIPTDERYRIRCRHSGPPDKRSHQDLHLARCVLTITSEQQLFHPLNVPVFHAADVASNADDIPH